MLTLLNRQEMTESMIADYRDELAALNDDELAAMWRAMRSMKAMDQTDWNALAREMSGQAVKP